MTPAVRALEAQILDDPTCTQPYLVLADALLEAGDPQGELVQLSGCADKKQMAREKRVRREVLGELAQHTRIHALGVGWHMGFVSSARLRGMSRGSGLRDDAGRLGVVPTGAITRALLLSPVARFLQHLQFDQYSEAGVTAYLETGAPRSLRRLLVEAPSDVARLAATTGALTTLGFGLWGVPRPELPALLEPLFAGEGLPALVDLRLVNCDDAVLEALIASPLFPRLRHLDVRRDSLTRAGAAQLAVATHLETLRVDHREQLRAALSGIVVASPKWSWE